MLGVDQRVARYTWTVALVLVLLYIVYLLRTTLFIFVLALLFAYLVAPLVDVLDRLLPARRTRTPALALAYVLFVGGLVALGIQLGSRVVEQANALAGNLPAKLETWRQSSSGSPALDSLKRQIAGNLQQQLQSNAAHLLASLPEAGRKALTLAGDLIYLVVIPILAFFFLKDAAAIRQALLDAVENLEKRALVEEIMADAHLLLAHYMRALVVLSLATLVAYSACFLIMGVPYTVLLAVLAAVLEFLPMIGPLAAAAIITIIAGVSGVSVWPILAFMAVYRLFQDYVLSPQIMGHGVELHPLAVIFGVFAGGEIAGIAGAFLSVPVLALLRIGYRRMRKVRSAAGNSTISEP